MTQQQIQQPQDVGKEGVGGIPRIIKITLSDFREILGNSQMGKFYDEVISGSSLFGTDLLRQKEILVRLILSAMISNRYAKRTRNDDAVQDAIKVRSVIVCENCMRISWKDYQGTCFVCGSPYVKRAKLEILE